MAGEGRRRNFGADWEELFVRYILLGALVALAGCAGAVSSTPQAPASLQNNAATWDVSNAVGSAKITHVIYIVQEGRSFDDLFQGYPGARTTPTGEISTAKSIALSPISLKARYDIDTQARAMFISCDGTGKLPGTACRMNGFNNEERYGGPKGVEYPMYAYVPHEESKPYFDMAREWVVADHVFASQIDGSFTAHQYIVAAQSGHAIGLPDGSWGCQGGKNDSIATLTQRRRYGPYESACFTYKTLANELERAHLSWRFYTADKATSSFAFDKRVYGSPQWNRDVVQPPSRFLNDVANGKLANMTWITPTCADSDDVNCGGGGGPPWVASLVNAVGESKFWSSTAVFVQWDDWGGLYDEVAPRFKDYDGLGFRVPLLVISAYAKHGHVSNARYETTSVLRFTEDIFGLRQLTEADRRATSPAADCFDFSQRPRKFIPIKT
jgi:phospholipase C